MGVKDRAPAPGSKDARAGVESSGVSETPPPESPAAPHPEGEGVASALAEAVAATQRRLASLYRLDLPVEVASFLMPAARARELLGSPGPRSGVLVLEEAGELWLGLYVDPADQGDPGTVVEETSHCVCLAWHALQGRRVSRLILELQADVDRYLLERLAGREGLAHFREVRWAGWMDAAARHRYERAHAVAHRYCRALSRRFPRRDDAPGLVPELRRFYRAPAEAKLLAA